MITAISTLVMRLLLIVAISICGACQTAPKLRYATSTDPDTGGGLAIRWFGTSTILIDDGRSSLLIDGFFSRTGLFRLTASWAGARSIRPDENRIDRALSTLPDHQVNAIFVAHSHHDHVLDTALVANKENSTVYGSESAINAIRGQDRFLRTVPVSDGSQICVGAFRVTVLAWPHPKTIFGPSGDITSPLHVPARLRDFKSGPTYAFHVEHPKGRLLIVPSPIGSQRPPALTGVKADIVLIGIGMLGREPYDSMAQYWKRVVCATGAGRVHPIHWDNFMRPIGRELRPLPFDDMHRSIATLSSFADADLIEFSYLPVGTPIALPSGPIPRPRSSFCLGRDAIELGSPSDH